VTLVLEGLASVGADGWNYRDGYAEGWRVVRE
jgi:hypothetical protein